ncbi:MAG: phosphatase [Candidatus Niyogibacteria bacterium CG10_big_fil_rev_8_21_14_0_10_42_19]|uniref:Phosphatase n=1 Tax=Candidatus Niyogibacteria bacterium CG10_big_fil_rev_8_21_14_0_10_42_19 TaxID=1974725 RepID=A0A2H0TGG8_9BACT|nr:MAG: phosphatase [Candidatus Niyogibacteria bacterium CG10_big_fil_rev_8_21_14_0_10_42_19]
MNKIDLQIHSTSSDGKYPPRELVEMSKNSGLETIAVTDHDTVAGLNEAVSAGKELGLKVIPGIEITSKHEDKEIHILGYGINFEGDKVKKLLVDFKLDRIRRAREMVIRLKKQGFDIEFGDVLREANEAVVARPHIALAILKNEKNKEKLGSISTVHDFIENFIVLGKKAYVERKYVPASRTTSFIHEMRGVAVWSHPAIHYEKDYPLLEEHLKSLVRLGIDGVEAFNPSQTEDETEFLLSVSRQYKLIYTAGSDFHREEEHLRDPSDQRPAQHVGDFKTFGYSLEEILPNLKLALDKRGNKTDQ